MESLSIDIETYSDIDLSKCGVYRYVESPNFEILLLGYAVEGGDVRVVDLARGETIPQEIIVAFWDDSVTKWAFNANFERVCLSRYLDLPTGDYLNPFSWKCSMIWSATLGLPMSLENVGAVLGLEKQKLSEGKDLIRYFCVPCKATKSNGGRTRNLPEHDLEKWMRFKAYNKRDVESEIAIKKRLARYPVPDFVWEEYRQDQEINDRGICMDMTLVQNAICMDGKSREKLTAAMRELTKLDNPNSVQQMKLWLAENGMETDTLGKKMVTKLLKIAPQPLRQVLELRRQLSKSSVKKYTAMENAVCADSRARGMFQFYGANRTGRYSGRLIQLQNLPQNHMLDLEQARELVRSGNFEALDMLYEDIPDTLSQLIRTAFVPRVGKKFIVVDFSAIEARVIAWIAGEQWRLRVFESEGDIYCESASKMFHVPVKKHGVNGHLRQKGKQAELACIAEGQLVLTDRGLIPIESVTVNHRLWDGESWINHDGVVFKGEGDVIEYEGLRATPDHLVWIEGKPKPIQFGIAASCGKHLVQTEYGGRAIQLCENYQRKARLYDIRNAGTYHRFTVSGKLVHNCGYGGSAGALKAMGALEAGMTEDELQPLVDSWRASNPNIVSFWWDVDRAVKDGIRFQYQSRMLFIRLFSGRWLAYVKPRMGKNRFGGESVTYMGVGSTKKWERIESYGPKFVENIVQATARDILCYAMRTLQNCSIAAHVHDEIIIEADHSMSLAAVCEQMSRTPPWASGLLLRADGYECQFYKKD